MNKSELRKKMSLKRNALSIDEILTLSDNIYDNLMKAEFLSSASFVFCYVNYKTEVSTRKIIEHCFKNNIPVAVPRVEGEIREMNFYQIQTFEDLKEGYFGIPEPVTVKKCVPDEKSVMIMPGMVFDNRGNRIGYGGGFYDTYLSKNMCKRKIAIAYDFQILNNEFIPAEYRDIKPDYIITDRRMIKLTTEF